MGADFLKEYAVAREVMERAEEALKLNLSRLMRDGPEDELKLTRNQRPAVFAITSAIYEVMTDGGFPLPTYGLGHSLGEYTALYAAGAMEFEDAIRLVRDRARYMEEAVPAGTGGMCAVLGLDHDEVRRICDEASTDEKKVWPANFNGGGQIVISGHVPAVKKAAELAKQRGARAIMLKVSGPFHTPLMQPAADRLKDRLDGMEFRRIEFPVVANVEARPNSDPAKAKELLVRQMTSPVLWEDSIKFLIGENVEVFIEVCPARVLGPLVERIAKEMKVYSITTPRELEETWDRLHPLL
ncbi:MAG TPA: [acyl-carrier-protein] S-malonyltransferase [Proteobacteria bacterium]|nr:[acyl-carrier-protein] S-malonyltransferase [Pseudomonadota bacterium]